MKIRILGAGPAGLYFAALMKRLDPSHDIAIFDRSARMRPGALAWCSLTAHSSSCGPTTRRCTGT